MSYNRREFIGKTTAATLGTCALPLSSCRLGKSFRGFPVEKIFKWSPSNFFTTVATNLLLQREAKYDYLDAYCEHCDLYFRTFLTALEVAKAVPVSCPQCSLAQTITIIMLRVVRDRIAAEILERGARALITSEGSDHYVHMVAPVRTGQGTLDTSRSCVCYGVNEATREPFGDFSRRIPAEPDIIHYYTDVTSAAGFDYINHVWRNNGQVTDTIHLEVGGGGWRTWSNKKNLDDGKWIVTAETPSGKIFDVKEFEIVRS